MQQIGRAAIIGDVIGSRKSPDRPALQNALRNSLIAVEARVNAIQPLQVTLGDEFQGLYDTMSEALEASMWLRTELVGTADIRIGMGYGDLTFTNPERAPFDQDGPCWWRARDATDALKSQESGKSASANRRTAIKTETSHDPLLNAFLAGRDELISKLDVTDAGILHKMANGMTLTAIAEQMDLNKSSVSRRARSHGLYTLLEFRRVTLSDPLS